MSSHRHHHHNSSPDPPRGSSREQPTIKVENCSASSPSGARVRERSDKSSRRNSPSGSTASSRRGSNDSRERNKGKAAHSPTTERSGSGPRASGSSKFAESSLGVDLQLNLHVRRKSSPCIGGLPSSSSAMFMGHMRSSPSPSRHKNALKDLRLNVSPNASNASSSHHFLGDSNHHSSHSHYHQHRRLSSPPSFDPRFTSSLSCDCGVGDCASGGASSGSNHSSGHGSLSQLSISGLNCSSTDMRENTLRSGHQQIQTLYAANNVTYPESISINMCNAPDNSTMQCDCGHINCPLCNLMMNLELTDPNVLQ